jgi:hypothetical protein
VLASDVGKVNVTTGTLTVTDIDDYDTGSSVNGQVSLGLGMQPNGTGQVSGVSGTVSGGIANHDREQVTKGAVGEGTITITDPTHQTQAVEEINRDTAHTQVITRDEKSGVQVYASSTAIAELAKSIDFAGKTLSQAVQALVDAQVEKGQISKEEGGELGKVTSAALKDPKVRAAVDTCASSGVGCSLSINEQIIRLDPKQAQRASDTIVVADLKGFLRACFLAACTWLGEEPPEKPYVEPTPIVRPSIDPPKPKPPGPKPK